MNLFQHINNLFFKKKDVTSEITIDSEFQPYMVTRYLSFYDNSLVEFANETFNKYPQLFDDKAKMYRLYLNLVPKLRYKRITYLSKKKKAVKSKKAVDHYKVFAQNNFMSEREVKMNVEFMDKQNENISRK